MLEFTEYPDDELSYLSRRDVMKCAEAVDIYSVVETAIRQHATGETLLPSEAYLGWQTRDGHAARSLAMPGAVRRNGSLCLGVKVINGSLGNPARGIARSQGLLLLFDAETAWPQLLMESAFISAMRTAAVTAVSARHLGGAPIREVSLLGCGTLARANFMILHRTIPEIESIRLFDIAPGRAAALASGIREEAGGLTVTVAGDPEECVQGADLIVPVTTATAGYLRFQWCAAGALICHLSLDDVLPEVVQRAGLIVVDDWNLVSQDQHRLLGRMYRQGELRAPDGSSFPGARADPSAPKVDTSLGEVVAGLHPGRASDDDVVLCNPFGMSVLDVALGDAVADVARSKGIGQPIPR
jgi:N-[(2S)-2-amino-2-carboxyethyl]-L-glutamate dehydrogenase